MITKLVRSNSRRYLAIILAITTIFSMAFLLGVTADENCHEIASCCSHSVYGQHFCSSSEVLEYTNDGERSINWTGSPHPHGTTPWTWIGAGSISPTHTARGHSAPARCAYPGCNVTATIFVPLGTCTQCNMPRRTVSMNIIVDDAALDNICEVFGIHRVVEYVFIAIVPFTYTWNIAWSLGTARMAPTNTPTNLCDNFSIFPCDNFCNTNCNNHHKNASRNLNFMRDNRLQGTQRLSYLLTGTNLCRVYNGRHNNNIEGAAFIRGQHAISEFSFNHTRSIRIIQHELSHNFGTFDHGGQRSNGVIHRCSNERPCIMLGSTLMSERNFRIENIWCNNCMRDFNRTLH